MKISVTAEVGCVHVPFLQRNLRKAARIGAAGRGSIPLKDLSIVLVGDRRMSALHKTFMNIAGTTDVLTFPIDLDEKQNVTAGEVYVCVAEAKRQSKTHASDVKLELLLYAIHGMLHLLGYEDRTARAYREMHQLEDRILTKLGLGPVFFSAGAGDKGACS